MKKKINCVYCNKENLSKNEIGLNKKILGENRNQLLCLKCLAEELEVSEQDLIDKVEEFKEEGCKLFT